MFGIWSDNNMYVEVGNGGGSYGRFSGYSSIVNQNEFYHIAMVFNGSGATNGDKLKLYINGIARTMTFFNGSIPSTTADLSGIPFQIARERNEDADGYFEGIVDDFRIYNYPLTQTQIRTVYNEGSAIRFGPMTGSP
jgi:hypothetical protein